ncbi:MAG: ATP-binding protein [Bacteroidota bacterium]
MKNNIRIAMSGTYSTGKTTTSYALSYLTGIPRTHAATMREILPKVLPGKRLEDCTPFDLYELGIRRLTERVQHEAHMTEGYISDGSALHEWVYGRSRMRIGINPNKRQFARFASKVKLLPYAVPFKEFNAYYGNMVKAHAKKNYDVFVHLPVEFSIKQDSHRPINEKFRSLSDNYLMNIITELNIPYVIVKGSVAERLEMLCAHFDFKTQMSVDEAVRLAEIDTEKRNSIELEYSKNLK